MEAQGGAGMNCPYRWTGPGAPSCCGGGGGGGGTRGSGRRIPETLVEPVTDGELVAAGFRHASCFVWRSGEGDFRPCVPITPISVIYLNITHLHTQPRVRSGARWAQSSECRFVQHLAVIPFFKTFKI